MNLFEVLLLCAVVSWTLVQVLWAVSIKPSFVRCKHCKWWNKPGCAVLIVDESNRPHENDFCSFGERRDDDETD